MSNFYLRNVLFSVCMVMLMTHSAMSIVSHSKRKHTPYFHRDDIQYKTYYMVQQVDHFGYANQDTYKQRYLVADQHWDPKTGPIFFYTGNEGDIAWFCNNTGLMWDWAPEFKALLVFAEHRYYGESLPYGNESYSDLSRLGYLTSEQALADFSTLLTYIKSSIPGADGKPVVAFGGSYGGMLAAWFRMKYPHVVQGALAASAPIWMFGDMVPCEAFYKTVTNDFKRESAACANNIAKSWKDITEMGKTESGRTFMKNTFGLCKALTTEGDVNTLKGWLSGAYVNLGMVDYPYAADFLEPLPAWPIREVCNHLSNPTLGSTDLIVSLAEGIKVYYNYTGSSKCLDLAQQETKDMGDIGWSFQACTEMVMPLCTTGINDMFEPSPWDYKEYAANCKKTWGANPRPDWILEQYGGKNITSSSNIIFSNGGLDPWSVGGVPVSLSDSLIAVHISEGAHHLDLRSASPHDPPSVIKARQQEKTIIQAWLLEYGNKQISWSDSQWPSIYMYKSSLFGQDDFTVPDTEPIGDVTLVIGTLMFALGAGVLFLYLGLAQNIRRHLTRKTDKSRNFLKLPVLSDPPTYQCDTATQPEKQPLI